MVVFSTLRKALGSRTNLFQTRRLENIIGPLVKRQMGGHGGHNMKIETTNFTYRKAVDVFHWYTCVSIFLYGGIMMYCNVFIGDGELSEIPEGYVPKYWEYQQHPIQRFIAWLQGDPQIYYENLLHQLDHEFWDYQLTLLEDKIKYEMKKNKDYKAYYYRSISANTLRHYREESLTDPERLPTDHRNYAFPVDFKDDGDWPEERPSS